MALSSLAPILRLIFRASLSTFMTSVGIIWTVGDNTYASIRYVAEQIVEFVENHTNLDIPRPNPDHTTPDLVNHHHQHHHINPVDNTPIPDNHTSYWLTGLSIALAGITISLTALLLTEYVYPETVHSIPVLNTLCDCIHVSWHYIWSSNSVDPGSDPNNINQGPGLFPSASASNIETPETISRSSSGSTDTTSTIRATSQTVNQSIIQPTNSPVAETNVWNNNII